MGCRLAKEITLDHLRQNNNKKKKIGICLLSPSRNVPHVTHHSSAIVSLQNSCTSHEGVRHSALMCSSPCSPAIILLFLSSLPTKG